MKNHFPFFKQTKERHSVSPFKGFFSFLFSLLLLANSVQAQDPAQFGTPFVGVPNRMDANIYQMNLREYSTTRNIAGARAKLQRIKDLGINVIYLMPTYPIGTDPKSSGSPYCIKDLKGVAADLGTLTDLRGFVSDAHNLGMAVILDWVANQTSWDNPWITQHPDWYKKDANGNIVSPDAGAPGAPFLFTDVAQVDLTVPNAAAGMVDALRYWVFAANIDGFRFDFADKSPQAFWTNTLNNLRGITSHKLLFLAEGSNEGSTSGCNTCGDNQPGAHYAQGFDYIFGTNFYYNVMKKVWNAGEPVKNLDGVTTGEYNGASSTQLVARFLSDHDDYNADGSPFAFLNGGRNGVMAAFLVATYHRGVPFIYNGIEVGNTAPLTYPWSSGNINWTQDLTVYTEMQKILNFRNLSVAIKRGSPISFIDPANTNPDIIAFTKSSGTEKVAVLVNVRNSTKTFTIPAGMAGTYNNAFTNTSTTLTAGSSQSLTAYQYIVLTNANVPVVAVTGVTASPATASVRVGITVQLSASIAPSNATNQGVTWTSSNTAVATVSANGLVSGITAGTATITVKTNDGNKTSTSAITVTPASTFTVHFYKPSAWATPINIYWWSALPAGVLADGVWPGVATTSEGNNWYKYTFTNVSSTNLIFNGNGSDINKTVNLNRAGTDGWYYNGAWYNSQPATIAVTGVTLNTGAVTVAVGATSQLTATVAPANATNKTVNWTSSNVGVASVSATGLVTGVGGGTSTITATTQDGNKTAICTITVPSPPATYYQIQNRFQPTQFLYDGGNGQVKYGTSPTGNALYQWVQLDAGNGYKLIKNRSTGNIMHVENQTGAVQCTAGNPVWYSAQWTISPNSGYVNIINRWIANQWIHNENQLGYAQYANPQSIWYSAQWQFVNPATARIAATEEEYSGEKVIIYPNPTKGTNSFYVSVPSLQKGETAKVSISNITGMEIQALDLPENGLVRHNLSQGLYLVKVQTPDLMVVKKLIVE